jgi:hypothetical protein
LIDSKDHASWSLDKRVIRDKATQMVL